MIGNPLISRFRSGYKYPLSPTEPAPTPPPEPWLVHPGILERINQMLVTSDGDTVLIAHGTGGGGEHNVATFSLSTGLPTTGPLLPTEGFGVAREYNGTLYLPWLDPIGPWEVPQGYSFSTDNGATWNNKIVTPLYHIFDMLKYNGVLYFCGAGLGEDGKEHALVWESLDDGATWQVSLDVVQTASPARIYHLAVTAGGLYVTATNTALTGAMHLGASGWEETAFQLDGFAKPGVTFGDWYVTQSYAFDGNRKIFTWSKFPLWSDATYVYGVDMLNDSIVRAPQPGPSDTGLNWEHWLDLGSGVGLGINAGFIHGGFVYVGGTEARIWRYPLPA